ncbi:MAG: hypothetical protein Q7U99_12130, partial [Rubrivivax sp.]|nr:hypothetical protein [Rubrivivax sp.]
METKFAKGERGYQFTLQEGIPGTRRTAGANPQVSMIIDRPAGKEALKKQRTVSNDSIVERPDLRGRMKKSSGSCRHCLDTGHWHVDAAGEPRTAPGR